jgi:hypothetical protein
VCGRNVLSVLRLETEFFTTTIAPTLTVSNKI